MNKLIIKDYEIILDDEDFEFISKNKLYIEKSRKKFLVRIYFGNGVRKSLSQFLIGKENRRVDFRDGNTLNFQKSNLFLKDKESQKKKYQEWYINNYEILKERSKVWHQINKEKSKMMARKYEKSKNGKINRRKRLEKLSSRYKRAQIAAKKRKKQFLLDFNTFCKFLSLPCYYCQKHILNEIGVGLDRINNDEGYIIDNVLTCCGDCNKTRSNIYTVEETKVMINSLLEFRMKCWKGKDDELIKLDEKK